MSIFDSSPESVVKSSKPDEENYYRTELVTHQVAAVADQEPAAAALSVLVAMRRWRTD
jgi:hypothetical protein